MLAVVSDIHGNIPALEACHADALARGCTRFVNLGDIVSGPLWPRETAEWLMERDWPTIAGNHERQLLGAGSPGMGDSDRFALGQLLPSQREWLASLPADLQWREDLYLCHANPHDDLHYLLHRVEPEGVRDADASEVAGMIGHRGTHAVACGHSHLPRQVVLADGRQVFNPGSVGLPAYAWDMPHEHRMELGSTHARYAVVTGEGKDLAVALIAVEYDHGPAADRAEANGRPDWAVALRTGRVQ